MPACTNPEGPGPLGAGRRAIAVAATLCLLVLAWFGVPARAADDSAPLERAVKAAFVYQFLNYVEWPPNAFASADAPVVVGIIGSERFAAELEQIVRGRRAGSRPIVVRRIKETDPLSGLQVLFVAEVEGARLAALARAAQQNGVLLVTESEGALASGSAINLRVLDGRVRFEVALDTAERSGLKLSSRLLALAQSVRTGRP
jgi:hypothetical protein